MSGIVAFWQLKGRMDSTVEVFLLFVGLIVAILILSRFFVLPRNA